MSYRMDKQVGDASDAGAMAAASTAAIDGAASGVSFSQLYPYYLVAVAAGVSVYFITKFLGRKS